MIMGFQAVCDVAGLKSKGRCSSMIELQCKNWSNSEKNQAVGFKSIFPESFFFFLNLLIVQRKKTFIYIYIYPPDPINMHIKLSHLHSFKNSGPFFKVSVLLENICLHQIKSSATGRKRPQKALVTVQ